MEHIEQLSGEDWERQAASLRSLARSLIADEHEAEDAVQETWLRFLGLDRKSVRDPRGLLPTILRNLSIQGHRTRQRRGVRERSAAREEAQPASDAIVERMELVKRVADHVACLSEPQRTVLHLRYFEAMSPREIARRVGVPLETVRSRLRRARRELRTRLDADARGDRDAWCSALAPVAGLGTWPGAAPAAPVLSTTPVLGVLGMSLRIKVLLAAVSAGLIGWVWTADLLVPGRSAGELPQPANVQVAQAAQPAPELSPTQAGTEPRRTVPAAAAGTAEPAPEEHSTLATDDVAVSGHLLLVDEQGQEHAEQDGGFLFHTTSDRGETWVEVQVEAGAWSTRVPAGATLVAREVQAAGRPAVALGNWVVDRDTEDLVLRARWTYGTRLRVVSAATGEELDGIELRSRSIWRARIQELLPSEGPYTEDVLSEARSPVDLPQATGLVTYWARSPGLAWGRIEIDHSSSGERRLALQPESALVVTLASSAGERAPKEHDYLRLRRQSRSQFFDYAASREVDPGGPTRFDALPPGRYLVCFERGSENGVRRGAEEWVELAPGAEQQVLLSPDPAAFVVDRVHLFGTLHIPPGGPSPRSLSLRIMPLDPSLGQRPVHRRLKQMRSDEDREGLYHWDAGELAAGQYVASISRLQHRQLIDATTPGEVEVEVVLPELVTLTIDVVDGGSGEELKPDRFGWSDGDLEGVRFNSSLPVTRDAARGRWRLVAPAGRISIDCQLAGYRPESREVELVAGEQELRIELERATGLRISLVEGGSPVRVDLGYWYGIRFYGADGQTAVTSDFGEGSERDCVRLLELPGDYLVHFPELEGYAPIEAVRVSVEADRLVELRVPVARE